ncbi:MAG TPA: hypothetical protein VNL77_19875 [Roseiflexaceae bacterium]|nr:hypothetical protein [Roseiflexaceae bacterium]
MTPDRQPRRSNAAMQLYLPADGDSAADAGPVTRTRIILLDEERILAANITAPQLVDHINLLTERTERILAPSAAVYALLLEVTLHPSLAPEIAIFSSGGAPGRLLQQLHDELTGLPPCHTREQPITFQIEFAVNAAALRGGVSA